MSWVVRCGCCVSLPELLLLWRRRSLTSSQELAYSTSPPKKFFRSKKMSFCISRIFEQDKVLLLRHSFEDPCVCWQKELFSRYNYLELVPTASIFDSSWLSSANRCLAFHWHDFGSFFAFLVLKRTNFCIVLLFARTEQTSMRWNPFLAIQCRSV